MSSWNQSVANCCGDCGICTSWEISLVNISPLFCSGCYGTWCGPCLVCQNANSLNSSAFCCSLLSCCLPCIPAWWFRDSARTRYDIEVSSALDFSSPIANQSISIRGTVAVTAVSPSCVRAASSARSPRRWRCRGRRPPVSLLLRRTRTEWNQSNNNAKLRRCKLTNWEGSSVKIFLIF